MLFRRAKKVEVASAKIPEIPWDESTMRHFTESHQFNVQFTSVSKRWGFGSTHEGELMREPDGYEVRGIMTYPKFILVEVSFDQDCDFGFWFYNLYDEFGKPGTVKLPCLELCLADKDWRIREALYESHKAALMSGARASTARFWKRPGDGVMTTKDHEQEFSYESRYPLIGVYIWGLLEANSLPGWAVPYGHERFSVSNLPPRYDLKL